MWATMKPGIVIGSRTVCCKLVAKIKDYARISIQIGKVHQDFQTPHTSAKAHPIILLPSNVGGT